MKSSSKTKLEQYTAIRPRLFGIAYRMLGTFSDAEDIVQETYLRLHQADNSQINDHEAWLVSVTTRLAIDRLRSAYKKRESYVGEWLPEPIITDADRSPEMQFEKRSELSIAFLYLLEKLSPTERAAFILRDVFERNYDEISQIIGKTEVFTRQIVSRARKYVKSENKRFEANEAKKHQLLIKFIDAARTGDLNGLIEIFSEDIKLISDGGGVVNAALKIVTGNERIARLYAIQGLKKSIETEIRLIESNGVHALLMAKNGVPFSLITIEISDNKIMQITNVMNPQKLGRLDQTSGK